MKTRLGRSETPVAKREHKSSGHSAAFLAATILGLFGVGITSTGIVRTQVASAWPEAEGRIVQSRYISGDAEADDRVDVEYTFAVDGQSYAGTRINYSIIWGAVFTSATHRRYPVGTAVQVHYDPSNPSRAVLEVRVRFFYWIGAMLSMAALSWGTSQWVAAAREERAA